MSTEQKKTAFTLLAPRRNVLSGVDMVAMYRNSRRKRDIVYRVLVLDWPQAGTAMELLGEYLGDRLATEAKREPLLWQCFDAATTAYNRAKADGRADQERLLDFTNALVEAAAKAAEVDLIDATGQRWTVSDGVTVTSWLGAAATPVRVEAAGTGDLATAREAIADAIIPDTAAEVLSEVGYNVGPYRSELNAAPVM